jgi:hypothetical protein
VLLLTLAVGLGSLLNITLDVVADSSERYPGPLRLVQLQRARGGERQQLKWLTYAGALAVLGLLLVLPPEVGFDSPFSPLNPAGAALMASGVLGIPLAVGVATLCHRLYDIDQLITRTVVYGLLTALVTTVYVAIVGIARWSPRAGSRCSCRSSPPAPEPAIPSACTASEP